MLPLIQNILRTVPLQPDEIALIQSKPERKTYNKKEYLLRIGEVCKYDYYIESGCVKVCYIDEKAVECIIKFAVVDYWVVDLDSFLNRLPPFITCRQLKPQVSIN